MNHTNATVLGHVGGEPVTIQQGPVWLATLLYSPPQWLYTLTWAVLVAVLALVIYGLYKIEYDEVLVNEFVANSSYIIGMGVATWGMNTIFGFPYLVDVGVGIALGWVLAHGVIQPAGYMIHDGVREQHGFGESGDA